MLTPEVFCGPFLYVSSNSSLTVESQSPQFLAVNKLIKKLPHFDSEHFKKLRSVMVKISVCSHIQMFSNPF